MAVEGALTSARSRDEHPQTSKTLCTKGPAARPVLGFRLFGVVSRRLLEKYLGCICTPAHPDVACIPFRHVLRPLLSRRARRPPDCHCRHFKTIINRTEKKVLASHLFRHLQWMRPAACAACVTPARRGEASSRARTAWHYDSA